MKFTTHNGYFTVTRGHVYLPENVEREDYIETCGRTCEVSVILDENNAVLHKCSVPPALYQEIKFPTDLSLLFLVWIDESLYGIAADRSISIFETTTSGFSEFPICLKSEFGRFSRYDKM